jgi:hypothetical protein
MGQSSAIKTTASILELVYAAGPVAATRLGCSAAKGNFPIVALDFRTARHPHHGRTGYLDSEIIRSSGQTRHSCSAAALVLAIIAAGTTPGGAAARHAASFGRFPQSLGGQRRAGSAAHLLLIFQSVEILLLFEAHATGL